MFKIQLSNNNKWKLYLLTDLDIKFIRNWMNWDNCLCSIKQQAFDIFDKIVFLKNGI